LIHAEGLTRTFGDNLAVDHVDLEVAEGDIYGFLGPNGAGKSTLVRMLCTLLLPTSGRASIAGLDVLTQPGEVRLEIGVALQDASLDPKMTGREIVTTQGRLFGLRPAEITRRIDELAPLIDMDAFDRLVGTYSGGMRRRLDLAASLVHNPRVLFLDEPTLGLDPPGRLRVWEEVRRLNHDLGMTVFLTTQYLEEADTLADRVGIIDHGRIAVEGPPAELKRSIGDDVVVIRTDGHHHEVAQVLGELPGIDRVETFDNEVRAVTKHGGQALSPVAVALDRAGIRVDELALHTPTLDDVFLDVTGSHLESGEA